MKIYANKRQVNLDSLIGKDVWIKIDAHIPFYIRILSKIEPKGFGEARYIINEIPQYRMVGPQYTFGIKNFIKDCKTTYDLFAGSIHISYPVEMFTTDEIEVV